MTSKEQNKILGAKIEPNVNQYKVDRLSAEISAFSSGDLNKYEFLKRIDLNYKPNALDKARFEFSPLSRAFNEGLNKTIPNYQEEGITKLLKEIGDNLTGLAIPPGPTSSPSLPPSSPSLHPSSPGSPNSSSLTNVTPLPPPGSSSSSSLTNVTPLPPPGSSSSSSLTNVTPLPPPGSSTSSSLTNATPLPPPGSSRKTQTVRPRPIMSKRYQSSDLDDALKVLDEQYKIYNLDNTAKEINERIKLLKEQDELEKQRQDELEKQRHEINKLLENTKNKQEEDIDWDQINELSRKANELNKNINSRFPTNLRKFAPRRDPFDDINKNKKKLTLYLSKIPAPIPKPREPQAIAVGEQASIEIMKNELKTSKNYIEYLKKRIRQYKIFIAKSFKNQR